MSEPEIMSADFRPPARGRPTTVDVEPVLRAIAAYRDANIQERWLAFSTYTEAEVRSLRRQLLARGYNASVARKDGTITLYVYSGGGRGTY